MDENNIIICRCSDISLADLKKLMNDGYTTFVELKQIARIGMGPCQAKTCGQLVARELAKFLNKPLSEVVPPSVRPPMVGVKLNAIAEGEDNEKQS